MVLLVRTSMADLGCRAVAEKSAMATRAGCLLVVLCLGDLAGLSQSISIQVFASLFARLPKLRHSPRTHFTCGSALDYLSTSIRVPSLGITCSLRPHCPACSLWELRVLSTPSRTTRAALLRCRNLMSGPENEPTVLTQQGILLQQVGPGTCR